MRDGVCEGRDSASRVHERASLGREGVCIGRKRAFRCSEPAW
jgi:hypothetical protein